MRRPAVLEERPTGGRRAASDTAGRRSSRAAVPSPNYRRRPLPHSVGQPQAAMHALKIAVHWLWQAWFQVQLAWQALV
jgi:hypothetical protein